MNIRPLHDRVLVKRIDQEEQVRGDAKAQHGKREQRDRRIFDASQSAVRRFGKVRHCAQHGTLSSDRRWHVRDFLVGPILYCSQKAGGNLIATPRHLTGA